MGGKQHLPCGFWEMSCGAGDLPVFFAAVIWTVDVMIILGRRVGHDGSDLAAAAGRLSGSKTGRHIVLRACDVEKLEAG